MPYLPSGGLGASIFLFRSVAEAEAHETTVKSGSGFLLGMPSTANPAYVHLYAVTNQHVAIPAPVIRAYRPDGTSEVIDDDDPECQWHPHPNGDDLAVRSLGVVSFRDYWWIPYEKLIAPEDLVEPGPGPGDECFMVGRYVNYEGHQFDRPVVRFGNLAMLPEPIRQGKRGFDQESFLVDMRSVSGFSGSAVTLYFPSPWIRPADREGKKLVQAEAVAEEHWLLGVDWGHLSVPEEIIEDGKATRVKVKSNMACVVPAWKLKELLDTVEDIVKPRERAEAELAKPNPAEPRLDLAGEDDGGSEYERFEDLARKLVRTPKPKRD